MRKFEENGNKKDAKTQNQKEIFSRAHNKEKDELENLTLTEHGKNCKGKQ